MEPSRPAAVVAASVSRSRRNSGATSPGVSNPPASRTPTAPQVAEARALGKREQVAICCSTGAAATHPRADSDARRWASPTARNDNDANPVTSSGHTPSSTCPHHGALTP